MLLFSESFVMECWGNEPTRTQIRDFRRAISAYVGAKPHAILMEVAVACGVDRRASEYDVRDALKRAEARARLYMATREVVTVDGHTFDVPHPLLQERHLYLLAVMRRRLRYCADRGITYEQAATPSEEGESIFDSTLLYPEDIDYLP